MDYFFIGDTELLTAFRFVGIEGQAVSTAEEALTAFNNCIARTQNRNEPAVKHHGVLIITEETALWLGETLTGWQLSGEYPLVVEIPGTVGRLPNRKTLVESIREAIGVHV